MTADDRARAGARLDRLQASLERCDSATLALDAWCRDELGMPGALVVATGVPDAPVDDGARHLATLRVDRTDALRYRRVRLGSGGRVLSEAENWFVPSRLSVCVNRALARSDVALGRAARGLALRRRLLAADRPAGPDPRPGGCEVVLRLTALLSLPDERPVSLVIESYLAAALGAGCQDAVLRKQEVR